MLYLPEKSAILSYMKQLTHKKQGDTTMRSEAETRFRERTMDLIEGHTGSLRSLVWNSLTTKDLVKLAAAILNKSEFFEVRKVYNENKTEWI